MRPDKAVGADPVAAAVRVAWVSSWQVRCGVAEYSRALIAARPLDAGVTLSVLADERTPAGDIAEPAWVRGEATLARLAVALMRIDAEVVVIQHHPGLLPWASLARLVRIAIGQGRAVMVTLHNTTDLLEAPAPVQAEASEALGCVRAVLVHTPADVAQLAAIGVAGPVTLIPHAAGLAVAAETRPLPVSAAPVIGCTGFFLPDKGIGVLIAAAAELRKRWPGVRLRLVNAEYEHPLSPAEIAACRTLADTLGFPVEWHTEYIPLAEQARLLAGCDVIALPYLRSKESSSAALRSALVTGIPVAVTPLRLFDEAEGAVFRFPAFDVAAIAQGLAELLDDEARRGTLSLTAQAWLRERATAKVAERLFGMVRHVTGREHVGAISSRAHR